MGNIVMGKGTYDMLQNLPDMQPVMQAIEVVVLSTSMQPSNNIHVARTPEEAVSYLSDKGMSSMLIAGGTQTYNAFVEADLVDEMYLNMVPVVVGNGGIVEKKNNLPLYLQLAEEPVVSGNVIRLHYVRKEN